METPVSDLGVRNVGRLLDNTKAMPYRQRTGTAGLVFHVINRGVRKLKLFHRPQDYRAFLNVFSEAQERVPIRCLAYCLMPNHFHLVLWPRTDAELSSFMAWLTATHSKRWHAWRGSAGTGHVYQGRFKSFPVFAETHFLQVCRYVERNALRAGMVPRAEEWAWCSVAQHVRGAGPITLADWPVTRPADWIDLVQIHVDDETEEVRQAVRRSAPYGPEDWRIRVANDLQLTRSLRRIGRPRS